MFKFFKNPLRKLFFNEKDKKNQNFRMKKRIYLFIFLKLKYLSRKEKET
jgi:hypothetical protein